MSIFAIKLKKTFGESTKSLLQ